MIFPLLFCIVFFSGSTELAAANLQSLIKQCDACHGPDGHPERGDVPGLAAMPIPKFQDAMAQFYYFERHCPDKRPRTTKGTGSSNNMCSIASTLSDGEVMTLAQHYHSK